MCLNVCTVICALVQISSILCKTQWFPNHTQNVSANRPAVPEIRERGARVHTSSCTPPLTSVKLVANGSRTTYWFPAQFVQPFPRYAKGCAVVWPVPSFSLDARFPVLLWRVVRSYLRFGYSFLKIWNFEIVHCQKKVKIQNMHFAAKKPVVRRLNRARFVNWYALSVKQLHFFQIVDD